MWEFLCSSSGGVGNQKENFLLLYIVSTCTSIAVLPFISWIRLWVLLQGLRSSYKLYSTELNGTAVLIVPAVPPDNFKGLDTNVHDFN